MDMRSYKLPKYRVPKINNSVMIYTVSFPLIRKPFKMIFNKISKHEYERPMNIICPYNDTLRLISSNQLSSSILTETREFSNKKMEAIKCDIITIGDESPEIIAKFYVERMFRESELSDKYDIELSNPFVTRNHKAGIINIPMESYNQSARYVRYISNGLYADEIELDNPLIRKVEIGDTYKFAIERGFDMFTIHPMQCTQVNITNECIMYTFVSRDNSCKSLYISAEEVKEMCSNYKEVNYHE